MTAPTYIRQRAAAHDARVAEVQRRRREEMPLVTALVERVRRHFPKATVVHADEGNGRQFGKPIPREETLSVTEVLAMLRCGKELGQRRTVVDRRASLSVVTSEPK